MRDIREKKHRLPRAAYRGRVTVSFTACVEDRRKPFVEESIVREFVKKLSDAAAKHHCRVLIYCFMPDHLHLVIQGIDESAHTWQAMVAFKQQTGFWFAQKRPEFGWQKDFHDHVIRGDEDLGAHIRYVANNPVRWGLVKDWREYPFIGSIGFDLQEVMADTATL